MMIDDNIYISCVCAPLSGGNMALIPFSRDGEFDIRGELFAIVANRTDENIDYTSSSSDIYETLAIAGLVPNDHQIVCVDANWQASPEELEGFLHKIGIDGNHILYDTSNTFDALIDRDTIAKRESYCEDSHRLTSPTKTALTNIARYRIAYAAYELWHEWRLRSYGSTTRGGQENIFVEEMEKAVAVMSYGHENIKFEFPMLTPYCLKKAKTLPYPELSLLYPKETEQAKRLHDLCKIWETTEIMAPRKGKTFTGFGAIEETGVYETIEALYAGVPIEDLLAASGK